MKFLELKNLIQTNELLKRLSEFSGSSLIEFEAYSCKKTKEEKKKKLCAIPLCYFIGALELTFEHEDYNDLNMNDFLQIKVSRLINDLNYIIFTVSKCKNETLEYIKYIKKLLKQVIGISNAFVYETKIYREDSNKIYVIYNQKMKRVLIVKAKY